MLSTVNMPIQEGINDKHLSDIVVLYESEKAAQEQNMLMKKKHSTDVEMDEDKQDMKEPVIPDEEMDNMLRECRLLAEMNNREQGIAFGGYSAPYGK